MATKTLSPSNGLWSTPETPAELITETRAAPSRGHGFASYIPCYALRNALGLQNSSNPGEKGNDFYVLRLGKNIRE